MRAVHGFCALLPAFALTACNEIPQPPEDYCVEKGRKLSESERATMAVTRIIDRGFLSSRLPHLWSFHEQALERNPDATPQAIAKEYVAANPECCELTLPWAFENYPQWGDTEAYDEMVDAARKRGMNRIVIVRDPPGREIPFADKQVRDGALADPEFYRVLIKQSACENVEPIIIG